jgi:hypothetical protein
MSLSLNDVVIKFEQWDRPLDFFSCVSRDEALTDADRALFARIWNEATDAKHWTLADLKQCSEVARQALHGQFPSLSDAALAAVVRAAAYQWK